MINFWKAHPALRIVLIVLLFIGALALVLHGWTRTGQLGGLGEMLLGVALLLCSLAVYNSPYSK